MTDPIRSHHSLETIWLPSANDRIGAILRIRRSPAYRPVSADSGHPHDADRAAGFDPQGLSVG